MKVNKIEKRVSNIVVKYDDGTEEIIKKGIAIEYKEAPAEDDEAKVIMQMVGINGHELLNVAYGFGELLVGGDK